MPERIRHKNTVGAATSEQNARYLAGKCTDCGLVRHAPGRVRCDACDGARSNTTTQEVRA